MTAYEIELAEPQLAPCNCCGAQTVRLTRFVFRQGAPVAAYHAAYCNHHPDDGLAVLVSLGGWGPNSAPAGRTAFYCHIRPEDDAFQVVLDDAKESLWAESAVMGQKLSREEALRHPLKEQALELLDELLLQDDSAQGFLLRLSFGSPQVPLEKTYELPEELHLLSEVQPQRIQRDGNFASLDDQQFFLRALLPIPVESYGTWTVGLWVAVSESDFARVRDLSTNHSAFAQLRFSGAIANDLNADLELPVALGTTVQLQLRQPQSPLHISAPESGDLARLMTEKWPQTAFESYAVARSYL